MAEVAHDKGDLVSVKRHDVNLESFEINQLFGKGNHKIHFPKSDATYDGSHLKILSGRNGSGKTTILKMLNGLMDLDFDEFRRVPFQKAVATFNGGHTIEITKDGKERLPLRVVYDGDEVLLAENRSAPAYTQDEEAQVRDFREKMLPVVGSINFDLLTTDRTNLYDDEKFDLHHGLYNPGDVQKRRRDRERSLLTNKIRAFLRDAQLNSRRFFGVSDFQILPNVVKRISGETLPQTAPEMLLRIDGLREIERRSDDFGLLSYKDELDQIHLTLNDHNNNDNQVVLQLLQTYVDFFDGALQAKRLLVERLEKFQVIMDDFLVNKKVRLHSAKGIIINSDSGNLSEADLSSGESHFLFMMVSALLCERSGSIIAIDEPELSLHVVWQRKLVSALLSCASGANPLFLLATHSTAISAAHKNAVYDLTELGE